MTVTVQPEPSSGGPQTLQAELASIGQGQVDANHAGFTGTGFVNFDNVAGSWVEFSVPMAAAGTVQLDFRYANGVATNRPCALRINGTVVADLAFSGTGSWTTWQTLTVTASLAAGTNLVRLTATGADGGPNLDRLDVAGGSASGDSWRINFQPSGSAVPPGFLVDSGAPFGDRGAGNSYGWSATMTETRDRDALSDQAKDTLVFMHYLSKGANGIWELAVPNGVYQVHLVCG